MGNCLFCPWVKLATTLLGSYRVLRSLSVLRGNVLLRFVSIKFYINCAMYHVKRMGKPEFKLFKETEKRQLKYLEGVLSKIE